MIEARHLKRSFGGVAAVKDVSFHAADGRITGLLGPNGAGKTTSLRMLYALLKPDAGTVAIDGIDTQADPLAARRRLGVLPDSRGLYKRLTARENIEYFGRLQGLDEATLKPNVDALIAALDLRDIEHRQADGFSQGQRVKTAIARALVHAPQNIVLDEPTNGLDVMATRALRQFLRDLRAQGRCIVFSSHVMQEVAALCDHIVVVAAGRVVASGTADELRALTGESNLEDAFVKVIGSGEGLMS
ncbi:ATP-binding cassette domain-containing protein [Nevskia sp.]|uniref:ABC transporter ATP-binding protein n=1 Tax=Nevskia sp. TaxID=1929292 RepID=UPI0025DD816F|nr:ATP-binding cassette domain-containing protein [Nevskia sp.]